MRRRAIIAQKTKEEEAKRKQVPIEGTITLKKIKAKKEKLSGDLR